jgi:plastocyanin
MQRSVEVISNTADNITIQSESPNVKWFNSRVVLTGVIIIIIGAVAGILLLRTSNNRAAASTNANVITITAKDTLFDLDTITVKVGQPVTVRLVNDDDMDHIFAVKALNVYSDQIGPNQTTEVTFTPQQTGDYEFFCSYSHHAELGMVGTLKVVK